MFRKPIMLKNISFLLNHKTCFEGLNAQIHYGDRIALIGNNGSGKSALLNMLIGGLEPSYGTVDVPIDVTFGYVPQMIDAFEDLSGGQRFNKALTAALTKDPNVLILDEPTNHLDEHNCKALFKMLHSYQGTLIVATHDIQLLRTMVDSLWHIDQGHVHLFSGTYDNYQQSVRSKRQSIEHELSSLHQHKRAMHEALMHEQKRTKKSNAYGEKMREQGRWQPIVAGAKQNQANTTAGKKNKAINTRKQDLLDQLAQLRVPEIITPNFSLTADNIGTKTVVSVSEGSVGYATPIISHISFSAMSMERIAIKGDNGSGKTTFIKALIHDPAVQRSGEWLTPQTKDIGYLDQHYATLNYHASVLEVVQNASEMTHAQARKHLNNFLFRKNEEVNALVKNLSGGEKARLSLALIAAQTPRLLILDEITNNIDLETREHIIEVLKCYPGAMVVISHDQDFFDRININRTYVIRDENLSQI